MKGRTITSEYHFSVTQIKRSAGQSAIAAAAYRAGEKLHSDYYGQDSDYTRKSGVVDKGVLLPSHVPRQYSDRQFLWNEVEKAEKHPKAQLAYSFDFALQNEFSMEENIAIAHEFIQRNFVDLGMIADYAIHLPDPKDGGHPNPHVHVMCPIRPMEPGGKWGAKQRRVYRLNADGSRARDAKGRELFDARPTTDWGTPERLETWRHAWAEINNAHFAQHGLDARIDNRSFEKQGIPQIPTIHEGPNVREMERRGIRTEKGDRNRWIRHINTVIRTIGKRLKELAAFIERLKEELRRQAEPTVNDFLAAYYDERNATAWGQVFRARNLHEYSILFSYLQEHGIVTLTDLDEHNKALSAQADPVKTQLSELRARLTALDGIIKAGTRYETNKPVYEKWSGIFFKKANFLKKTTRLQFSTFIQNKVLAGKSGFVRTYNTYADKDIYKFFEEELEIEEIDFKSHPMPIPHEKKFSDYHLRTTQELSLAFQEIGWHFQKSPYFKELKELRKTMNNLVL